MRNLITVISLVFSALFITINANATHFMGSEIQWECLGNNQYKVTVTIYKDCGGVKLGSRTLDVKCAQTGQIITTASQPAKDPTEITRACQDIPCTTCKDNNGNETWENGSCQNFPYGIAKYTFEYQIDLSSSNVPSGCCEVTLSVSGCCRDSDITTGGADDGFYTEATLNRCVQPCDNSPSFGKPPFAIFCKDQKAIFNPGFNDPDTDSTGKPADSLSFGWAQPMEGSGNPVNFNAPYSFDKPIEFQGFPYKDAAFPNGLHLDSTTGDLKFVPTKKQETIMAFKVEEFRNGTKIGEIRRDMQVIVRNCAANTPPKLSGIDGSFINRKWRTNVCKEEPVNITINSQDTNLTPTPDTVTMGFNKGTIPGNPSWSDNSGDKGVRLPTGNFNWVPSEGTASSTPYQFLVSAEDDNCPIPGRTTRSYQIRVKPIPNATYTVNALGCGKYEFIANPVKNVTLNYDWLGEGGIKENKRTFTHQFDSPGKYVFDLNVSRNGCTKTYTDTVTVPPFVNVDIGNDTTVCEGSSVTLGGTALNTNGNVTYQWQDGSNGNFKTFNNLANHKTVYLTASDAQCSVTDTAQITVNDNPVVHIQDRRICVADTYHVAPVVRASLNQVVSDWIYLSNGMQQSPSYQWKQNNMVVGTDSTFTTTDSGTYTLQVKDTLGCKGYDTFDVCTNPDNSYEQDVCAGDSVLITAPNSGNAFLVWENLKTGTVDTGQELMVHSEDTGDQHYKVRQIQPNQGVTDSFTYHLQFNPSPEIQFSALPDSCANEGSFTLDPYVNPTGGTWSTNAGNNSIESGKFYPNRTGNLPTDTVYELYYDYTNPTTACSNIDTTNITVRGLPQVDAGPDTFRCTHEGVMSLDQYGEPSPTNSTNGTYQWEANTGISGSGTNWDFDPNSAGWGIHTLTYTFTEGPPNAAFTTCSNEDQMTIEVIQSPDTKTPDQYQMCMNEDSMLLGNAAPIGGEWVDNAGYVSKNGWFNPPQPGTYEIRYKGYTGGSRCMVQDTSTVKVHNTPQQPAVIDSNGTLYSSITGQSYQWYADSNKITGAINRAYNPTSKGVYQVKVWDSNCSSMSNGYQYTTAIEAEMALDKLKVYPNPNEGAFTIEGASLNASQLNISIINSIGKEVWSRNYNGIRQDFEKTVRLEAVPAGVYLMKLHTQQATKTIRILVE